MSGPSPGAKASMGGLDALVAAASAAGQASSGVRGKRKRGQAKTDHAVTDTTSAIFSLLTNPIFVSALAASTQSLSAEAHQSTATSNPPMTHFTQNDSMNLQVDSPAAVQTRSGRISRPPVQPSYNLLQALSAELESGTDNFESLLRTISSGPNTTTAGSSSRPEPVIDPELASPADHHAPAPMGTLLHGFSDSDWANQTLASAAEDGMRDESMTPDGDMELAEGELPAWPLPPGGRGGRKNMPKDEMLARRRARNRVAAVESRRRKKSHMEGLEGRLREKEFAYQSLQLHCRHLEHQLEQLQQVITSAGLPLPAMVPSMEPPPAPPSADPTAITPFYGLYGTPMSLTEGSPLPPLDMFFNTEMDGEDDGEFLPPSSPANGSEGESPRRKKGKGKNKAQDDEEDDDEFVDEDVENEDLFLPIEDVPVPPDAHMQGAMRSLGVENQDQLASLIQKMVVAGKEEGMTTEMVDKLKVLVSLVGPNGRWSGAKGQA